MKDVYECKNLIEAIQLTLDYIEDHIYEPNLITKLSMLDFFRIYHVQRSFSLVSTYSLSQYIMQRKMTHAAMNIGLRGCYSNNDYKLYGYESRKGFEHAFKDFHGFSPSEMISSGCLPRLHSKLMISFRLIGGENLNYYHKRMPEITFVGTYNDFNYDVSKDLLPAFFLEQQRKHQEEELFAVIRDNPDGATFSYFIGRITHDIVPDNKADILTIPSSSYYIIDTTGPFPQFTNNLREKIFKDLLPNIKQKKQADYIIEKYYPGDSLSDSYKSEIWIPAEDIKEED